MPAYVVIGSDERARDLALALDAIVEALTAGGALNATPERIAPYLGIKPHSVRHYCRQLTCLKTWKGQYTFQLDDPQHVEHLRSLVRLALWSMKSAPRHRKPVAH
ncbi:hypothetical protein EON83_27085 [bacterium]|nr:MAG: hypothetical protein EON83_27085 [bacterium]